VETVTPFGRRVATFVGACLVFDLYGYAVYHAWRTHLLGPVPALVLLTLMAVLGIAGMVFAPAWIRRAGGQVPAPLVEEPRKRRPWWFPWLLALASIAGGAGLAAWSWIAWPPPAPPTVAQWLLLVALDAACVGFLVFTIVRLKRPERFGLALGVILTIDGSIRLVGGFSVAHILSLRFVFGLIQMGVIYLPICLWGGYLWRRIMTAIFTPPKR
jgi:hypothetical protein